MLESHHNNNNKGLALKSYDNLASNFRLRLPRRVNLAWRFCSSVLCGQNWS